MINQPDGIDIPTNLVDQFILNPNNAQMIDETIEKHKHIFFANMAAQGLTIASPDTPVTVNLKGHLNNRYLYNNPCQYHFQFKLWQHHHNKISCPHL